MINSNLYDLNLLRAKQFNVKIIFVGDKYQLSPVNERISKCFVGNDEYELLEIVRQEENNPLLKLLTVLRHDIDYSSSTFLSQLTRHNNELINDNGYIIVKESEFKEHIHSIFNNKLFEQDVNFCRFTSWTNKDIKKWNKFIRDDILDNPIDIVHKDDLFTGYNTIVDEYFNPIIVNSDDYIVDGLESRISDYGFKVFLCTLKSLGSLNSSMVNIVDHNDNSFSNYYNLLNNLHFNAIYASAHEKGKRWREYFDFKNRYLTLIDFNLFTKGDTKIRGKVSKDLDYGYGLTTHKSQGSTYNNVFVNLKNIIYYERDGKVIPISNNPGNPYAIEFRNKLAYVALSRASKKAIILL
jgi:exodeoxyribonuclease-5